MKKDYSMMILLCLLGGMLVLTQRLNAPPSPVDQEHTVKEDAMSEPQKTVQRPDIQKFFNDFNKDTMHLLDEFYDETVVFHDPLEDIEGRDELQKYYEKMYQNVTEIRFDFTDEVKDGNTHALTWTMVMRAKGLNGGKEVSVPGVSVIKFGPNGKAIYHRDYFDMGAMVYEHVPLVGGMVRFINRRMSVK